MGPEWAGRAIKIFWEPNENPDVMYEQTADLMELKTPVSRNPIAYILPNSSGETELAYLCLKCDYFIDMELYCL
jgi:hypothetical protein